MLVVAVIVERDQARFLFPIYFYIGLTIMACYLQRLSHLSIASCGGVTSLMSTFKDINTLYNETIPPNPAGLLGCQFLQYLNVSNCVGIKLESINGFIKAQERSLKVRILYI